MILWLYSWLRRKNDFFSFRTPNWMFLVFSVLSYDILFKFPFNVWVTITIITILGLGVLNYPYCYLKNRLKLELVPRMFKERFYILCGGYGDFSLSSSPNEAIGMLVGDLIYLDSEYDFLVLWGMKDNIRYFDDFSEFLNKDITKGDNQEVIKRKLILRSLTP